jgi:Fe-S cluster assembly ATP-binding protein
MKILEPKMIILDEIDSGLDVDSLKIVADNINDYKSTHPDTSILIITHYNRILDYIKPDYVHIMTCGKITKTGDYKLAKEIENSGYNITGRVDIMKERKEHE